MTVNPSAAESNSRWLVGEFVGRMLQRECLRTEERKTREQRKYDTCVFVCWRVGQRERRLKIDRGPRKEDKKVGERCQFKRQRETHDDRVHKTSSSTSSPL